MCTSMFLQRLQLRLQLRRCPYYHTITTVPSRTPLNTISNRHRDDEREASQVQKFSPAGAPKDDGPI